MTQHQSPPVMEPIHREEIYLWAPFACGYWVPVPADFLGFEPQFREWYAPIEDET